MLNVKLQILIVQDLCDIIKREWRSNFENAPRLYYFTYLWNIILLLFVMTYMSLSLLDVLYSFVLMYLCMMC
jgi:hypothetical protein